MDLGPNLIQYDFILTNHICKNPTSKCHSHRYQGLGLHHIFLGDTGQPTAGSIGISNDDLSHADLKRRWKSLSFTHTKCVKFKNQTYILPIMFGSVVILIHCSLLSKLEHAHIVWPSVFLPCIYPRFLEMLLSMCTRRHIQVWTNIVCNHREVEAIQILPIVKW